MTPLRVDTLRPTAGRTRSIASDHSLDEPIPFSFKMLHRLRVECVAILAGGFGRYVEVAFDRRVHVLLIKIEFPLQRLIPFLSTYHLIVYTDGHRSIHPALFAVRLLRKSC